MKTTKLTITLMTLLVGLSLVNSSCKKDNSNQKNELLGIPKIESITITASIFPDTLYTKYAYDSQGRIFSSISKRNNLPYEEYTYSYNDSSIIETIKSIDTITYYYVKSIDKNIYITEENNYEIIYTDDYKTDGKSLIIKDNNIIKDESTETIYSYYLDRNNTIGNKNIGITFKGNDNQNLIKTKTSSNGIITTYTYEFDSLKRVKKQIITENSHSTVFTYTYY